MSPLEKVCFEKVFNHKLGINGESIEINDKKSVCSHYKSSILQSQSKTWAKIKQPGASAKSLRKREEKSSRPRTNAL